MCVAVPSLIIEVEGATAVIDVEGIRMKTSLLLLDDAKVGDYVIVHAGYAIHIIDEEEALETLKILRQSFEKE